MKLPVSDRVLAIFNCKKAVYKYVDKTDAEGWLGLHYGSMGA